MTQTFDKSLEKMTGKVSRLRFGVLIKNPPVETRLGFLVKNEIFKPQILNDGAS